MKQIICDLCGKQLIPATQAQGVLSLKRKVWLKLLVNVVDVMGPDAQLICIDICPDCAFKLPQHEESTTTTLKALHNEHEAFLKKIEKVIGDVSSPSQQNRSEYSN